MPVIAAGGILTPDDANAALETGLSMVAIGRGLIINPDWVSRLQQGQQVDTEIDPARLPALGIPPKLWGIIEGFQGWIPVRQKVSG